MKRKMAALSVSLAAVVTTTILGAGVANAQVAQPTGAEACPQGSVCLYYNSPGYGWGAWENWTEGEFQLDEGARFMHWGSSGRGYGSGVAYNAASIVNNTRYRWYVCGIAAAGPACFYFDPGYSGGMGPMANHDQELMQG